MSLMNEVVIFKPNSRQKQTTISSPLISGVIDPLKERLGNAAANKVRKALTAMGSTGMESAQIRIGDRRVRIKQIEA